jgi:hypothetical protein
LLSAGRSDAGADGRPVNSKVPLLADREFCILSQESMPCHGAAAPWHGSAIGHQ